MVSQLPGGNRRRWHGTLVVARQVVKVAFKVDFHTRGKGCDDHVIVRALESRPKVVSCVSTNTVCQNLHMSDFLGRWA